MVKNQSVQTAMHSFNVPKMFTPVNQELTGNLQSWKKFIKTTFVFFNSLFISVPGTTNGLIFFSITVCRGFCVFGANTTVMDLKELIEN